MSEALCCVWFCSLNPEHGSGSQCSFFSIFCRAHLIPSQLPRLCCGYILDFISPRMILNLALHVQASASAAAAASAGATVQVPEQSGVTMTPKKTEEPNGICDHDM